MTKMNLLVPAFCRLILWRIYSKSKAMLHGAISLVVRNLPLQNKIVFGAFYGKGFCDEPKYILLELLKEQIDAKFVWIVNDMATEMPDCVKKSKYGSLCATYHYLTAKIWIDNVKGAPKPKKRPGQFYLQTWHGCWALKKVEQAVEDKLPAGYVMQAKEDAMKTDLMFINNRFFKNQYENSFWYDGPVIDAGSPCFSVLLHPPKDLVRNVRQRLGVPLDRKLVLYAPTFREDSSKENLRDLYQLDVGRIEASLEKRFGGKFALLLRLHPNVADLAADISTIAVNATSYPDIYELLSTCDVLITDFSSTMAFMAYIRRPVFLFARDFDSYVADERGLAYQLEKLPFPIAKDETSLLKAIVLFDEAKYKENVKDFISDIGMVDDGQGVKKICRILKRQLR